VFSYGRGAPGLVRGLAVRVAKWHSRKMENGRQGLEFGGEKGGTVFLLGRCFFVERGITPEKFLLVFCSMEEGGGKGCEKVEGRNLLKDEEVESRQQQP